MKQTAYIALGGNLGDSAAEIERAFDEIAALPGTELTGRSSLYRSAPIAETPQPDYLNAAARVSTRLSARELLQSLLEIEKGHGRLRLYRNAPRTLDLDILLYGDSEISEDTLEIPHPRMHLRKFVLAPLLEISPDCVIPGRGRAQDLLQSLNDQIVTKLQDLHHAC